jgi:hypothetical protein
MRFVGSNNMDDWFGWRARWGSWEMQKQSLKCSITDPAGQEGSYTRIYLNLSLPLEIAVFFGLHIAFPAPTALGDRDFI